MDTGNQAPLPHHLRPAPYLPSTALPLRGLATGAGWGACAGLAYAVLLTAALATQFRESEIGMIVIVLMYGGSLAAGIGAVAGAVAGTVTGAVLARTRWLRAHPRRAAGAGALVGALAWAVARPFTPRVGADDTLSQVLFDLLPLVALLPAAAVHAYRLARVHQSHVAIAERLAGR